MPKKEYCALCSCHTTNLVKHQEGKVHNEHLEILKEYGAKREQLLQKRKQRVASDAKLY